MTKKSTSRAVRFDKDELKDIDQFLSRNPIFDFSSLARAAIRAFIENPEIKINKVERHRRPRIRRRVDA